MWGWWREETTSLLSRLGPEDGCLQGGLWVSYDKSNSVGQWDTRGKPFRKNMQLSEKLGLGSAWEQQAVIISFFYLF